MEKLAPIHHEIHPILRKRWSPRAFSPKPIDAAIVHRLFEAARWAPSSGNSQPWGFVIAHRRDGADYAALLDALLERNAAWAQTADLLVLAVAQLHYVRDGQVGPVNRHARYDLGQAVAHLAVEADEHGLFLHQMAGFDPDKARLAANVPEDWEPVTMIAIGYPGNPDDLPEDQRAREFADRHRKRLSEFVHRGQWQKPYHPAAS